MIDKKIGGRTILTQTAHEALVLLQHLLTCWQNLREAGVLQSIMAMAKVVGVSDGQGKLTLEEVLSMPLPERLREVSVAEAKQLGLRVVDAAVCGAQFIGTEGEFRQRIEAFRPRAW